LKKKVFNDIHDLEELIRQCIGNNEIARLKLYEYFAKSMYNTSLRIVKDTMIAEDVMQESFLAAFQSLKNFRNEIPFSHWLRKIVINRSFDYLRKKKNAPILFDDQESLELLNPVYPADEKPDPSLNEEMINRIKIVLQQLPDGYRIIFSLFYFEGYDHDEISSILNISPSTSRSQLTRARQLLIKNLKMKKHE